MGRNDQIRIVFSLFCAMWLMRWYLIGRWDSEWKPCKSKNIIQIWSERVIKLLENHWQMTISTLRYVPDLSTSRQKFDPFLYVKEAFWFDPLSKYWWTALIHWALKIILIQFQGTSPFSTNHKRRSSNISKWINFFLITVHVPIGHTKSSSHTNQIF